MDVVDQLGVVVAEFERVVRGVRIDQLDNPTPCEGWVVRDLFYHLVAGEMFLKVVRGEEPTEEEINRYLSQSTGEREDLGIADEDWADRVLAAASMTVDTFRSPGALERKIPLHLGELTGEKLAWLSCFEFIAHGWDLATATGQTLQLPDELVGRVEAWAVESVVDDWRQPYTFGPVVEVGTAATPIERLVAVAGRTP